MGWLRRVLRASRLDSREVAPRGEALGDPFVGAELPVRAWPLRPEVRPRLRSGALAAGVDDARLFELVVPLRGQTEKV